MPTISTGLIKITLLYCYMLFDLHWAISKNYPYIDGLSYMHIYIDTHFLWDCHHLQSHHYAYHINGARILELRNIFISRFINQYLYQIPHMTSLCNFKCIDLLEFELANTLNAWKYSSIKHITKTKRCKYIFCFISSRRKTVILYIIRAIVPCKYFFSLLLKWDHYC